MEGVTRYHPLNRSKILLPIYDWRCNAHVTKRNKCCISLQPQ
jgi:hypothetical protein